MPRKKNPSREAKRLTQRNRKFIRKDTQEEYKLREGMVFVKDYDGTQTFFRPSDLAIKPAKEKAPKPEKCGYCREKTIRKGITAEGERVPMCVTCGIEHDHTPKAPVITFGQ